MIRLPIFPLSRLPFFPFFLTRGQRDHFRLNWSRSRFWTCVTKDDIRRALAAGCNIEETHDNEPPIVLCAMHGDPDCLKFLLELGAESNIKGNGSLKAAAARKGEKGVECLKILVRRPTYPVAEDLTWDGLLNQAAMITDRTGPERLKILLDGGANANEYDTGRQTPLIHIATRRDPYAVECAVILLRAGARIDLLNAASRSPLQLAAEQPWPPAREIVRTMLELAENDVPNLEISREDVDGWNTNHETKALILDWLPPEPEAIEVPAPAPDSVPPKVPMEPLAEWSME